MGDALANFVYVFLWVYLLLLFAYILTSWIRLPRIFTPIPPRKPPSPE